MIMPTVAPKDPRGQLSARQRYGSLLADLRKPITRIAHARRDPWWPRRARLRNGDPGCRFMRCDPRIGDTLVKVNAFVNFLKAEFDLDPFLSGYQAQPMQVIRAVLRRPARNVGSRAPAQHQQVSRDCL